MAPVTNANGTKLLVQIGDGGSPTETFAHDCGINAERGIDFSSDVTQTVTPDCDSPDDPAWKETTVDGLSATISGGGQVHTTTAKTAWYDWWASGAAKNCRVFVNVDSADGGGYWQGAFRCTQYGLSGDRNAKMTNTVTIVSDGALTWTAAP